MEITLKVEGQISTGSAAYVSSYLRSCKVVLRNQVRPYNSIALFLQHENEKHPALICFYDPSHRNTRFEQEEEEMLETKFSWATHYEYNDFKDGYFAVWPTELSFFPHSQTLFGAITPAGRSLVKTFIRECVSKLSEIIDDDAEQPLPEIKLLDERAE